MTTLNDEQKKAVLAVLQPKIDTLVESIFAALGEVLNTKPTPTPQPEPTPTPTPTPTPEPTPQPTPTPTPTPTPQPTPTPTPVPEAVEAVTATFNGLNEGDWKSGVWVANDQALVSLNYSADLEASTAVGSVGTFADGSKRTVAYQQVLDGKDKKIHVKFEGSKLDPKLGFPNNVKFPKKAGGATTSPKPQPESNTAPTPVPTPTPTPSGNAKGEFNSRNGAKGQIFVNLGMGMGAETVLPGQHGRNYVFPKESEIIRAKGYGFKELRIGFLLERAIRPGGKSELYRGKDASGNNYTIDQMIEVGRLCKKHGVTVMWDAHNYGGFSNTSSGANRKKYGSAGGPTTDQFAKDWLAIIRALKSDKDCWAATARLDTMNEWCDIGFPVVKEAAQKLLDLAGREAEDKIFVFEGINYSNTPNWVTNNPGYQNLKHPVNNKFIEFSAHLYLDPGQDGYYTEGDVVSEGDRKAGITTATVGVARVRPFAKWLKDNGYSGNLGENMVTGTMSGLMQGERALLEFCVANGIDVYLFGMGDAFGTGNAHNIELGYNKPMLDLAQAAMKF